MPSNDSKYADIALLLAQVEEVFVRSHLPRNSSSSIDFLSCKSSAKVTCAASTSSKIITDEISP